MCYWLMVHNLRETLGTAYKLGSQDLGNKQVIVSMVKSGLAFQCIEW